MTVIAETMRSIWRDYDPYANFPKILYRNDTQGWGGTHPWLAEAITTVRPRIVVEIGVWKGSSTITLAKTLQSLAIDGCVISIDTWLGAWDHWLNEKWFDELCFENGQPQIMKKFMQNVIQAGLKDYVVPLPLDSVNASWVLSKNKIVPDLIHIDGAHDYRAVTTDLELWWPMLRPGGMLIGDDYKVEGGWPGVLKAFDDFFLKQGIAVPLANETNKCRVVKPIRPSPSPA